MQSTRAIYCGSLRERRAEQIAWPRVGAGINPGAAMFKFAIIFLVISLVAGAIGLTNVSQVARRISMALFALFFLMAAVIFGLAWMIGAALT
jgi:uncharacterized membrane protein YtjA (UPF0391 family)